MYFLLGHHYIETEITRTGYISKYVIHEMLDLPENSEWRNIKIKMILLVL
jgi:hypothetical protein